MVHQLMPKFNFKCLLLASENAKIMTNTEDAGAKITLGIKSHHESNEEDELNFIQNGSSAIV